MKRKGRQSSVWAICGLIGSVVAGCQSKPESVTPASYEIAAPRSAPFPGALSDGDWEEFRRDAELGIGYRPRTPRTNIVETRILDRRSTVNGRVRESGRITTRIIQRSFSAD